MPHSARDRGSVGYTLSITFRYVKDPAGRLQIVGGGHAVSGGSSASFWRRLHARKAASVSWVTDLIAPWAHRLFLAASPTRQRGAWVRRRDLPLGWCPHPAPAHPAHPSQIYESCSKACLFRPRTFFGTPTVDLVRGRFCRLCAARFLVGRAGADATWLACARLSDHGQS